MEARAGEWSTASGSAGGQAVLAGPEVPARWALSGDGGTVEIRPVGPADRDELLRLHRSLPPNDRYLRFFTLSESNGALYVEDLVRNAGARPALGAFRDGALLAVANFAVDGDPTSAEFAIVVGHHEQAHGIGTVLLEHLVPLARARGVETFTADVLAANSRMLRVLTDFGLPCRIERDGDVVHVTMPLDPGPRYLDAIDARDRAADLASLRPLLRPRSVTVVGAGRSAGSVGHAVLANLVRGGFTGALTAVNPHAREILGVACHPSVADLPEAPELAVVCVPAAAVPAVVDQCAARGVRGLVVISAGVTRAVLETVRLHGMRMIGPNCVGVATTDPLVRLDATFMDRPALPGGVGLVCQSGGIAIALTRELGRVGLGVSTVVSTGDKLDVSGNDLLHWWTADEHTDAVVLYLESFGNPRKFSRLSRALSRDKPVVAVRAGVSEAGSRAAGSHTAALATPAVVAEALYRQAGVTAVDSTAEAVEALALLLSQPLPRGGRVAVVTNAGGAGVLAADACARHGLTVPGLAESTMTALRGRLPAQAAVANPVDTTAVIAPDVFAAAVADVLADPGVDSVVAVTVSTALGDPGQGVPGAADTARKLGKPLVEVRLGQPVAVDAPAYADPATAVRALSHAVARRAWLDRPAVVLADPPGVDRAALATTVARHLAGGECWLDPADSLDLLAAAGVPVLPGHVVRADDGGDAAVEQWHQAGGPVAVKAVTDGLLHKGAAGGLVLNLTEAREVRAATTLLVQRFGDRLRGVFVQPMATPGAELLVGVRSDPRFGPLLVFGTGGSAAEALADRAVRLCPLTEADLADLPDEPRLAGALFGPGAGKPDRSAVADVLHRVACLAELVPEIAELDINPLIAGPGGCLAVDARVRLAPATPYDPTLRSLPVERRS